MRVRLVTPWFPTPSDPVNGSFVAAQAEALVRRDHDVACCVVRPLAPWPAGLLSRKWASFAATPVRWTWGTLEAHRHTHVAVPRYLLYGSEGRRMARALSEHVNDSGTDVIIAHTELVGEAVLRGRKVHRAPVVVVIHGINRAPGMLSTQRRRNNMRWTLQHAERVIVVGPRLIETIVSWGAPRERVRVVPNGFDTALVAATEAPTRNGVLDRLQVLSVSNLVPGKGVDVNLRALALVREDGFDVDYTVVGDGRSRRGLERLARAVGVADQVRFLGRLEPAQVHRELAGCDLFSLPSSPEAFGIVYVEAMAHAKPIVGCIGEGPELFCRNGEDGFLVPQNDPAAVARAWLQTRDPECRRKLGEAARVRAWTEFTWDASARQLETVLQEVVRPL